MEYNLSVTGEEYEIVPISPESQLPKIFPLEESSYAHMRLPRIKPSDIPQPEGKIYRG